MKLVLISYPKYIKNEEKIISHLFENGLRYFHLRKPNSSYKEMEDLISKIPEEYHSRIKIHSHYELLLKFDLGGIHFGSSYSTKDLPDVNKDFEISRSCHSLSEISSLTENYNYVFLSPIFDSISKSDYQSKFSQEELKQFFADDAVTTPVIALGGINTSNALIADRLGFEGVAILGDLWHSTIERHDFSVVVRKFVEYIELFKLSRPAVLSIAGFDPSGGAGILADIKTFEMNFTRGYGACSALTFQNDKEFYDTKWIEIDDIIRQINSINHRLNYKVVKIGMVQSFAALNTIIDYLLSYNPLTKIVWDPILSASNGFVFHEAVNIELLTSILRKVYLITPNLPECFQLFGISNPHIEYERITDLLKKTGLNAILIKGGHSKSKTVCDYLFSTDKTEKFESKKLKSLAKHGSGCVLSSTIAAHLALGEDLTYACKTGHHYIQKFLASNDTLIGYHSEGKEATTAIKRKDMALLRISD